jgi:SAM-dependent methyltransferase
MAKRIGEQGVVAKAPLRKAKAATRTLGPVSDLERHLPNDWWRTLFNSLYLETDGDVVENDRNTEQEIDLLIRSAGLEPNDRVLDLCCGQGRHALELARRGFKQVTGIDRSRYLVRLARKRARQRGHSVSFHEGDARKFHVAESSFHCVCILGNSFGYFDREEDDSKWVPESSYWDQIAYREASLDEDTRRKLVDYSIILFERLGCRDYARFDFRADAEGEIKLLEVNPNPGWSWDAKLNMMATAAGLRYSELLRLILEAGQERVLAARPRLAMVAPERVAVGQR